MTKMFDPQHPGLIVASELDYLHIGEKEFADKIGVDSESVAKILRAVAPITPDIADRLAKASTSLDAAMWLRMQAKYDAWQSEHRQETTFKEENISES